MINSMRVQAIIVHAVSLFAILALISALYWWSANPILAQRQAFDRAQLQQFFAAHSDGDDLVLESYLIPADPVATPLVNTGLLGLQRDRLAYRARKDGEVVAIAVPATAEDGFNGVVELLISVDMFGRIGAARVIEDLTDDSLHGTLATVESKWMEEFSGNTMRDILGISWSTITADREYDQFVGASITPKAVSNRIYDALVFYQSNRIELMQGHGVEL